MKVFSESRKTSINDCIFDEYKNYIEEEVDNDGENRNPQKFKCVLNTAADISSTQIGCGILSLPLIIKTLGLIPGLISMIIIIVLMLASSHYLLRCKEITKRYSYSLYSRLTWGIKGIIANKFLFYSSTTIQVSIYFIVFGDCLKSSLEVIIQDVGQFYLNKNFLILIYGILLIFLIFKDDFSFIYKLTNMSIISLIYFVISLCILFVYKLKNNEIQPIDTKILWPSTKNFKDYYTIISGFFNEFIFHIVFWHIYLNLKPRNYKNMQKSICLGSIFTALIYYSIGLMGYLIYRDRIDNSIVYYIREDIRKFKENNNIFMMYILLISQILLLIKITVSIGIVFNSSKLNLVTLMALIKNMCFDSNDKTNEEEQELSMLSDSKLSAEISKPGNKNNKKIYHIEDSFKIIFTFLTYGIVLCISIFAKKMIYLEEILGAFMGNYYTFLAPCLFYLSFSEKLKGYKIEKFIAKFLWFLSFLNVCCYFLKYF